MSYSIHLLGFSCFLLSSRTFTLWQQRIRAEAAEPVSSKPEADTQRICERENYRRYQTSSRALFFLLFFFFFLLFTLPPFLPISFFPAILLLCSFFIYGLLHKRQSARYATLHSQQRAGGPSLQICPHCSGELNDPSPLQAQHPPDSDWTPPQILHEWFTLCVCMWVCVCNNCSYEETRERCICIFPLCLFVPVMLCLLLCLLGPKNTISVNAEIEILH